MYCLRYLCLITLLLYHINCTCASPPTAQNNIFTVPEEKATGGFSQNDCGNVKTPLLLNSSVFYPSDLRKKEPLEHVDETHPSNTGRVGGLGWLAAGLKQVGDCLMDIDTNKQNPTSPPAITPNATVQIDRCDDIKNPIPLNEVYAYNLAIYKINRDGGYEIPYDDRVKTCLWFPYDDKD